MKVILALVTVDVADDYPSKPWHAPIAEVIEAGISDGLRWKDGVEGVRVGRMIAMEVTDARPAR